MSESMCRRETSAGVLGSRLPTHLPCLLDPLSGSGMDEWTTGPVSPPLGVACRLAGLCPSGLPLSSFPGSPSRHSPPLTGRSFAAACALPGGRMSAGLPGARREGRRCAPPSVATAEVRGPLGPRHRRDPWMDGRWPRLQPRFRGGAALREPPSAGVVRGARPLHPRAVCRSQPPPARAARLEHLRADRR